MKGLLDHVVFRDSLMRVPESVLAKNSSRIKISHDLRSVEKLKFDDTWYYYKHFRSGTHPALLELEAFSGDIYHLLLGRHRAPRTIVVEDDKHQIQGLLVESIESFRSCHSIPPITASKAVGGKLIQILVACYFLQEDDLHSRNIGLGEHGFFCKIDHDMSLWPLSIQFKGDRIQQVFPYEGILWDIKNFLSKSGATSFINNQFTFFFSKHDAERLKQFIFSLSPAEREKAKFPFTLRDIDNFPYLTDSHPYYWPYKWIKSFSNEKESDRFVLNKRVCFEKWMMFTIICLIPKSFYVATAHRHIANEKLRANASLYVTSSKIDLRRQLIQSAPFRDFIQQLAQDKNTKLKDLLWQRFENFNKENPTHYKFKREAIEEEFSYLFDLVIKYEKAAYFDKPEKSKASSATL